LNNGETRSVHYLYFDNIEFYNENIDIVNKFIREIFGTYQVNIDIIEFRKLNQHTLAPIKSIYSYLLQFNSSEKVCNIGSAIKSLVSSDVHLVSNFCKFYKINRYDKILFTGTLDKSTFCKGDGRLERRMSYINISESDIEFMDNFCRQTAHYRQQYILWLMYDYR
jgi:hypothetical protein